MRVSTHVSDLFFNRDFSDCTNYDENRNFAGWRMEKLREEAEMFLTNLGGFAGQIGGVFFPPTADELVDDFLARV